MAEATWSAASFCIVGLTCMYTVIVMFGVACPSRSWTTLAARGRVGGPLVPVALP
jgi:hypothetical protein